MAETRPKDYPRLTDYQPTKFMLPTSHYDEGKADRAVKFIENLRHTKGKWAGKRFWLLPWQEQIIRDIFGIVGEDNCRQFRTAFIEIGKKNGKSELAAAVALYLLYADNEPSAEVYGAAADRGQASIVFDVANQMVKMTPALMKRSKIMSAGKRIVNYSNQGFYQVLSAEVGTKHGLNVSGLVLDEVHAQKTRTLYDVLTKGSGDAREQPLFFLITTADTEKESICYELHTKATDILEGRKIDPTFYPVVFGLTDDDDWHDEANWYKANPSLGQTIQIDRVRDAYKEALQIQQRRTCLSSFDLTCGYPVLQGLFRSRYMTKEMSRLIWIAFLEGSAMEDLTFQVREILQLWCLYFHQGRKKQKYILYRFSGFQRIQFQSG